MQELILTKNWRDHAQSMVTSSPQANQKHHDTRNENSWRFSLGQAKIVFVGLQVRSVE